MRRVGPGRWAVPWVSYCWGPCPAPDQLLWRHLPFVLKGPVVGGWSGDQGTWKMGTALPWWVGVLET